MSYPEPKSILGGKISGSSSSVAINTYNNVIVDSSTSRVLSLTDAGKYIRFTSGSNVNVTIPQDSSVGFPIGTCIYCHKSTFGGYLDILVVGITIGTNGDTKVYTKNSTITLKKTGADTWDVVLSNTIPLSNEQFIDDLTSARTLALTDVDKFIRFGSSSSSTITIPLESSVPFPNGSEIHIICVGTGDVYISGTVLTALSLPITTRYTIVTLKKYNLNFWYLY